MRYGLLAAAFAACCVVATIAALNHDRPEAPATSSPRDRDAGPSEAAVKADAPPPESDEPPEGDEPPSIYTIGIPPEEISRKLFILPMGRTSLTREERIRLGEEPGYKFVRYGPKGSPYYNMGFMIGPYPAWSFEVVVKLDGPPDPKLQKLAEEAKREILRAEPSNPARRHAFPKWRTVQPNAETPGVPLVHTGWSVMIERIEPIRGGWRARVGVRPQARTEDYLRVMVVNVYYEVYTFKDGVLDLEAQFPDPDPDYNAEEGLSGIIL